MNVSEPKKKLLKMREEDFQRLIAEQKIRKDNFNNFRTAFYNEQGGNVNNVRFFEIRLEKLQAWWLQYDKANSELISVELEDQDKEIEYFKNDEFSMLKREYQDLRDHIQGQIVEVRKGESSSSMMQGTPTSPAKKLIKSRFTDIGITNVLASDTPDGLNETMNNDASAQTPPEVRVMQFQVNEIRALLCQINNEEFNTSTGLASAQLEMLKMNWSDLRATHRAIIASENNRFAEMVNLNQLQAEYLSACGKLIDISKKKVETSQASLPKLKLPEFNGTDWLAFRELFDEIVHNNDNLSEKAKAQYLKTVLKGEAALVMSRMGASEDNYNAIYDALVRRYHNKRQLVNELMGKLFNLPKQSVETSAALRNMYDTVNECMAAIANLGVDTKNWDPLVVYILTKKLSKNTVLDYESKLLNVREIQSLCDFMKYIENRFMAILSSEGTDKNAETCAKSVEKQKKKDNTEAKATVPFKCTYCEKAHSIYKCVEFAKLDPKERFEWSKQKKACFVCLQIHSQGECKSKFPTCKICAKKHNTLLHLEAKKDQNVTLVSTSEKPTEHVNTMVVTKDETNLLATAIVRVKAKNGDKIVMRAIIDQASQGALLTESALQKLALPTESVTAGIDGVSANSNVAKKRVELEILPRFTDDYVLSTRALILKKITNLAVFKGDLKEYSHLQNLRYADPTANDEKQVDLLLSVADYARIVTQGLIKGADDEPIAQNSEFGWLIMGPQRPTEKSLQITTLISNVEIKQQIKNFFTAENMDSEEEDGNEMSEEEKYCETIFLKTTKREADGRFVTAIPFKNGQEPKFGDSKKAALATLFQLEKRFEKYPKVKQQYTEAMTEAIESGHMKLVENVPRHSYYVPHHAVFKQSSTTKLRPVYNASKKSTNGLSLNEQVAIGKMDQPDMLTIILRWRKFKFGILADLEKMYKQIKIPSEQYHLQLILWRENASDPIKTYAMTTVTFGVAPSPYLAIRVLKEIAKIAETSRPLASEAILKCFYVDNFSGGASTVDEAKELCAQLIETFDDAKFNLRKFACNEKEIIDSIPEQKREQVNDSISALGVQWDPKTDEFVFKVIIKNQRPTTKRQLFAQIATLYDPVGFLAPMIIKARILMQNVWQEGVEWDGKLPEELINQWEKMKSEFPLIENAKVPRWVNIEPKANIQLHGFCDASGDAYSATLYVKNVNENKIELLMAKTRVTPKKNKLTIPKLELCGALLLTKLTKKSINALEVKFDDIYLWCDSKIVLAWIRSSPKQWKKFVSSRVEKIQKFENVTWCHIPGEMNPADCASRGILASELLKHKLWWHGPQLLKETNDYSAYIEHKATTNEEVCVLIASQNNDDSILPDVSDYFKLKKVLAFVLRFVKCVKDRKEAKKGPFTKEELEKAKKIANKISKNENFSREVNPITVSELKEAEKAAIKITQSKYFEEEITALKCRKNVKKTSALYNLCTFLDNDGILRVGGRLQNARIPFDMKHQIVLPKYGDFTTMVIKEYHQSTLHGGPKVTEACIRRKFWIIKSQTTIKKELRQCVTCAKQKPKVMQQFMADLPAARVVESDKAFARCAVDFAGPIRVKTSKIRNAKIVKGYVAIFVCLVTKAMHIELVGDLTADSFVAALRRFVARRGRVTDITSDNGPNFVRTIKILEELSSIEMEQFEEALNNELLRQEIRWHYSPAASPHFNGLVEASVKTMKFHLKRQMGDIALTNEEWITVLCQIEAVANSRPICGMSDDPNDTTVLTPAHFLHTVPVAMVPDEDLSECRASYLTRWRLVQSLTQSFWKKWKDEYLHQLQVRTKWHTKKPDVEIGEIVTLKDENLPPGKWKLGRVVKKHTGADGHTRVVEVKTENNTLKRAIAKIAPLPVRNEKKDALAKGKGKQPGILPIITAMLAIFAITLTPINAETTNKDIAKAVLDGAVRIYTSDVTKQWLARNPPTIDQIPKMNAALNTNEQKEHAILFKWLIIAAIFAMVIVGTCVGIGIVAFNACCKSDEQKRSKEFELQRKVNEEQQQKQQRRQNQEQLQYYPFGAREIPTFQTENERETQFMQMQTIDAQSQFLAQHTSYSKRDHDLRAQVTMDEIQYYQKMKRRNLETHEIIENRPIPAPRLVNVLEA